MSSSKGNDRGGLLHPLHTRVRVMMRDGNPYPCPGKIKFVDHERREYLVHFTGGRIEQGVAHSRILQVLPPLGGEFTVTAG